MTQIAQDIKPSEVLRKEPKYDEQGNLLCRCGERARAGGQCSHCMERYVDTPSPRK